MKKRRRRTRTLDDDNLIRVDDRAGSRDLVPHLPENCRELTRLEYGDVAFRGNGPEGEQLDIGYELKSIPDLVACIHDGRFAGHQLPGMQRMYDLSYLVVLDRIRSDRDGLLQYHMGHGKWRQPFGGQRYPLTLASIRKWLLTVEVQGGVRVLFVDGLADAGHVILAHYKWWRSSWNDHKSLKTFDDSKTFSVFSEPSTLRKMAAQFKQIRWVRSRAVEKHFDSVRDMVLADESEWREIEGVGPKIARAVVEECGRVVGSGVRRKRRASADRVRVRGRRVRKK